MIAVEPSRLLCVILLGLTLLAVWSGAGAQRPAPPIADWLREAGIPAGELDLAVAIRPLDPRDGIAWQLDAERPLNPASAMKLVTTWAALNLLGPQFRWRTTAHLGGPIVDGVLHGDLVLGGGGDPKLVSEDLGEWIARMRAAGLHEIRGDLVIDDVIFAPIDDTQASLDGELTRPYNVQPSGALLNFKATRLIVRPQAKGVAIELDPPLADVLIDNRVRLRRERCRSGVSGLRISEPAARHGVIATIRVDGLYSAGCGEQGRFAAVLDHVAFARAFFAGAWRAAGGNWSGAARLDRGAAQGEPWLEWRSPRTLAEVVDDVNHLSNNVMARQLLLQLAAARGVRPADAAAGRQAVVDWLAGRGLHFPGLVLDNGSGLSRTARISATSLADLLVDAAATPLGERFRQSLPLLGMTGTVRHRLVGDPLAGRAWLKTGSLDEVRSIAGYLEAASGRRYVIVVLANGARAPASVTVQDRLLRWLHQHG